MENITSNLNWSVTTERNSPSMTIKTNGITRNCRVISQITISPDGSKIQLEQHISNEDDFHDVLITKV